ncbi:MAG: DUF4178 domain-containing protein [Candidatus Gastranaerophilales bacterium]|nr:DUF4178 domain-containing protein [Candidatus Gastranaerophilales bacterium]
MNIIIIVIACLFIVSNAFVLLVNSELSFFLLVIGALFLFFLIKRNYELSKHNINAYDEKALIIQNVKQGGVIKITHLDGYIDSLDLKVNHKHVYTQGDYSWFELECIDSKGEKFWVEVDDDDSLVISVLLEKLSQSELKFSNSLEYIDENESGNLSYKGNTYIYEDSGEANFYKYCDTKRKEKFYYWDFKYKDYIVSVEKWNNPEGRADMEYSLSKIISPSTIIVYSNGGEENE